MSSENEVAQVITFKLRWQYYFVLNNIHWWIMHKISINWHFSPPFIFSCLLSTSKNLMSLSVLKPVINALLSYYFLYFYLIFQSAITLSGNNVYLSGCLHETLSTKTRKLFRRFGPWIHTTVAFLGAWKHTFENGFQVHIFHISNRCHYCL